MADQDVDVVIVGAGFSGLYLLHRMRELGLSTRVLEAADDVGGTWYWNRYPGAQCDTEAYCYLPLLEEIGYLPKEKYSKAAEILEHSRAIGRHFDLYRDAWCQEAAAAMPNLRYVPVVSDALPEDGWSGRTGFVHRAVLQDFPNLSGHQVYACGAPIVVDSARKDYTAQAGLPDDEFFADSFTSEADKHP